MNKKGSGIGSASLVLIFTVLCFSIFTLISFTAAENDMALARAEAALVKGYYEADALAFLIASDIAAARTIPASLRGTDIHSGWDEDLMAMTAEFSRAIAGQKELYVKIAVHGGTYDILVWQMRDTGEWQNDTSLRVWFSD